MAAEAADRRIRTPRLVLEPVDQDLARRVLAGEPFAVRPGAGWPHDGSIGALQMAVEHDVDPGWFVTLGGLVIGECGTKGGPDPTGTVEIGYGLAAPWRGQGFGRELVAGLAGWLLARPDIMRVVAEVLAVNVSSRRVLERAGFGVDRLAEPYVWYVAGLT